MLKTVHMSGKRKMAVARATVRDGKGRVRVNSILLENYQPELARLKIQETLMLASDYIDLNKVNISVNVRGGGVFGQAEAVSSSIARSLIEFTGSDDLLHTYTEHDRTLIAGDHRQTEPHKPSQSRKGPRHKRQKSYR